VALERSKKKSATNDKITGGTDMNKKLPFEDAFEQQMNNLPTPNEDESWQKMKQLLDDKERRTPLAFFKSNKVWGILVLLLIIGVFFIFNSINKAKEKQVATSENNTALQQKSPAFPSPKGLNKTQTVQQAVSDALPKAVKNQTGKSAQHARVAVTKKTISNPKIKRNAGMQSTISQVNPVFKSNKSKQNNWQVNKHTIAKKTNVAGIKHAVALTKSKSTNSGKISFNFQKNNLSVDKTSIIKPGLHDTSVAPQKDFLSQKENITSKENTAGKKAALHRLKKYFISAGIGVQQQIPVAGQQIIHFRYKGNNNVSDYIPSIWLKLERDKKWFLQGEFIYGAPQLLKEFAYSRQTQKDSSGTVTTNTLRLKKTFYNEIPLSFNYYLHPNLSAGIGAAYSWLHGAIAEKEVSTHNPLIPTSSVVQQIIPINGYTDSFLYRSHTYLLLQTDYQWRRLSAGLRYTKDMQSYIKYTLPDGAVASQKNWSLQFMLRFRLWKSVRF